MSTREVYLAIAIVIAITFAIRTVPLFFFSGKKQLPKVVGDLGNLLPYSMMGLLIVYCLRTMRFTAPGEYVPLIVATVVTALSYLWKRKSIVSIILGTAVYMFLIQSVFV